MMRGLRLDWKKEASLLAWTIRRPNPPQRVRIFLNLPAGPSVRSCVKPGDPVRVGQRIAEPRDSDSVAVHASLSGMISAVGPFPHPYGGEALAVEIQSDFKDEKAPGIGEERKNWEDLEPGELKKVFQDCGLVQMRETMTPLHPKGKTQSSGDLILNGCESEPYVTCAHALMMSHPLEILKGAEIFRKALSARRILFVIEDNKLEAAELLKSKIFFLKWRHIETAIVPAVYPQDHEKVLARSFSNGEGGNGKGPPPEILDVASAFAVWEAVARQKPLYERAVTIGGECVIEPKNFWARVGTDLGTLFKNAKGLLRPPEKIILGGPMRGYSQPTSEVPILKGTTAVLALPHEVLASGEEQPCIRCGRCLEVCPEDISPVMITLAAERNLRDLAQEYEAGQCIECGNCSYVCPSRRPMVELIRSVIPRLDRGDPVKIDSRFCGNDKSIL